jgi:two-component system NtrC family sensor kinase
MDVNTQKTDLINYLGNVSLFNKADESVLKHLAAITLIKSYNADQTVITKGDVGESMYVILSGKLKVHDGGLQVAELKEGEFFGELSLLDSEPRSMSVTTLEEAVLASINRNDFYEVLKEFPEMTKDIIAVLNRRLRGQNDRMIKEYKGREDELRELVRLRTLELEAKNSELELAMDSLKKSQQQLIQSEKLASLGQLIAGIAHEIQNPLNFVNNFSQLSTELVKETRDAVSPEERDEILDDLQSNLVKINHHGKRADSIVKNMLEHSRTGSGEKQPTNINQLCKEYITLAYQGMRATYPDFNCELNVHLTEEIKSINAVSQDISRVLLNIFNNAFYALNEKAIKAEAGYHPSFSLTTALENAFAVITVVDNGPGIPSAIKDKVFEPFYTTKPTGQGTGLGLSLSHDIVKAHGGEIFFNNNENGGTTFIIRLPV